MLSISVPMAVVVVLVTPLSIMAATLIAKFSNKSFTAQQRIQGQLAPISRNTWEASVW